MSTDYKKINTKSNTYTINGIDITFDTRTNKRSDSGTTRAVDKNVASVIDYFINTGKFVDKDTFNLNKFNSTGDEYEEAIAEAKNLLSTKLKEAGTTIDAYANQIQQANSSTDISPGSSTNVDGSQASVDNAQDILYNSYWNNLFQRNREGTLGNEAYNELLTAEQNAAQNAIDLSNLQAQQLAMAQAQTVKNITDQLKAERMSMLRSGMSESQIASQDMQQMIANTNALNEQIAASNIGVVQGRQQLQNAQQTAYQNWLNSMNQTATNAAAMAAADTGDATLQAKKYSRLSAQDKLGFNQVTGTKNN